MARPRRIGGDSLTSSGFLKNAKNSNGFSTNKELLFNATATTQGSAFASVNGGSPYSTPFYLMEEKDNKYRIDNRLTRTLEMKEAIPFLRTNDTEYT